MSLRKAISTSFWLLVVVVAFDETSWSQEKSIVSPSEAAEEWGDTPLPAGTSVRAQFLHRADDFMPLPESHRYIEEIAHRSGSSNTPTHPVSGSLTLRLSTTAADSLSTVLDENIGDDETVVFEGMLTWQDMGPGPTDFDFVVPFDEPFTYDPSQGKNLLVDFFAPADWDDAGNWQMDLQSTDYDSTAFAGQSAPDQILLVTKFTFVSGPSAGDFNMNGVLDVEDIDSLSAAVRGGLHPKSFDLNGDDLVDGVDHGMWVHELKHTWYGDADLDGKFNSDDLIAVFQAGEYRDAFEDNSGWATGDWDGDGDFTSDDLVLAFKDGGYRQGPRDGVAAVPEPSATVLVALAATLTGLRTRGKRF